LAIAFALSKAMEESSTHPVAKAVAEFCAEKEEGFPAVHIHDAEIKEVPGEGMTGTFSIKVTSESEGEARSIRYEAAIGNQRLLSTIRESSKEDDELDFYLNPLLNKYQTLGHSTAIFALRQLPTSSSDMAEAKVMPFRPTVLFSITDPLRATTASVLHALQHDHHLEVHMCTGDNMTTARAIASQVGIPVTNIRAGVLPQDKAAYIQELQSTSDGTRLIVAFVGDGTNDTPALSAADVSIALSSGSDVAISTASFILLNSDLETILRLVKLAKRVFRRVKMNFAWAGVYNVCLVPIAAGVTYPAGRWRLGPVWASAAMAASSVSVVASSLALRAEGWRVWKGNPRTEPSEVNREAL
jgi:cation transport ATPase